MTHPDNSASVAKAVEVIDRELARYKSADVGTFEETDSMWVMVCVLVEHWSELRQALAARAEPVTTQAGAVNCIQVVPGSSRCAKCNASVPDDAGHYDITTGRFSCEPGAVEPNKLYSYSMSWSVGPIASPASAEGYARTSTEDDLRFLQSLTKGHRIVADLRAAESHIATQQAEIARLGAELRDCVTMSEVAKTQMAVRAARDERDELRSTVAALTRENESLKEWRRLLEVAPGELAETIRERCLSSAFTAPIVESWRKEVERLTRERDEAVARSQHVDAGCTDLAIRRDALATQVTTLKLQLARAVGIAGRSMEPLLPGRSYSARYMADYDTLASLRAEIEQGPVVSKAARMAGEQPSVGSAGSNPAGATTNLASVAGAGEQEQAARDASPSGDGLEQAATSVRPDPAPPLSSPVADAVREIDYALEELAHGWHQPEGALVEPLRLNALTLLVKHWPTLRQALAALESAEDALREIASLSVHTHGLSHRMYFGSRNEVQGEASIEISEATANALKAAAIRSLPLDLNAGRR